MKSQYIKRSLTQLPGSIPTTDRTLDQIGQIFCSEPNVFFCLFVCLFLELKVYDKKYSAFIFIQKFLDIYFCLLIPSPEGGVDET